MGRGRAGPLRVGRGCRAGPRRRSFKVLEGKGGAFSLGEATLSFTVVSVGGVVIGLAAGWAITFVLARLEDPPVEVLVRPPALLGRDLPEVRAATPEVKLDTALP